MKIIAVINQKGGVAKSTTAGALAAGLTKRGYNVLSVDMDPQGNFSYAAMAHRKGPTILGVLTRQISADQAIQKTYLGDTIASCSDLAGADAFIQETGKEYRLRESLAPMEGKYDFVIMDTPPALGILTVNALTAADLVVIPTLADIFSLDGIRQLAETIGTVRKYCNRDLQIGGILLTRHNTRSILSRDMAAAAEEMAQTLNTKVYATPIRDCVAIREAQALRQSLFDYAPKSNASKDYTAFIDELLADLGIEKG